MPQYEFHAYAADADGNASGEATVTVHFLTSDGAAQAKAGRLSKSIKGPVDLARAGAAAWEERYLTTAFPSENHAKGYGFERLA